VEAGMFKHVLIPTDGSPLSEKAALQGVHLAKSLNAAVTAFHAAPKFHVVTYKTEMLEDTKQLYEQDSRAHAEKYVGVIENAAREAGVSCKTSFATSDHPYEAIIAASEANGCDLVVMASHGRKGVQALLLGSETQKVLTHSRIPVLVLR
jgi:nucleotide-binding universal stress UspA family protein